MLNPGQYPNMLAAQLTGRLLSVLDDNVNIQNLLRQCDEEGPIQHALVPTYHCMHTPGGPLKYSLEGHVFAVFGLNWTVLAVIGLKWTGFDVIGLHWTALAEIRLNWPCWL